MSQCHGYVVTRCPNTCHSQQTDTDVISLTAMFICPGHSSQGGLTMRLGHRLGSLRSEVGEFLIKHPLTDGTGSG